MLTQRFMNALALAFKVHDGQVRKAGGRNKSYFGTHLMAVCSYVQEVGGNEDEAIAAILHDAVEDRLEELASALYGTSVKSTAAASLTDHVFNGLAEEFGKNVSDIIAELTDPKLPPEFKKAPKEWKQSWVRTATEEKVKHLRTVSDSVRLVKACDSLHNLRSLLQDRTENGPVLWKSFVLGCSGTIWKYEKMTEVFEDLGPEIVAIEMRKTLNRLKEVSKDDLTLNTSK